MQAQRDPFLHLVMAGPDEVGLRARLEARAALLGVAERITWTGMLSGDAKWGALQAADVFALTSHQENFGVAVVEALAVGLPVLITHAINIAGVIAAAGAGLVESDTEEGAKRLLAEWLALDASGRARMRAAAKACFEAHFHIDRTVHALQRLVREARHGSAGAAARAPLSDVSL